LALISATSQLHNRKVQSSVLFCSLCAQRPEGAERNTEISITEVKELESVYLFKRQTIERIG